MNAAALGPQTRELTEAEQDAVSGGAILVENPTANLQWSGSGGVAAVFRGNPGPW